MALFSQIFPENTFLAFIWVKLRTQYEQNFSSYEIMIGTLIKSGTVLLFVDYRQFNIKKYCNSLFKSYKNGYIKIVSILRHVQTFVCL